MRDWIARARTWKDASLLRRVVVTVTAFVMLCCLSIGTMSFAAVTATRAVFKPADAPSASASGAPRADASTDGASKGAASKRSGLRAQRGATPGGDSADKAGDIE